MAPYGELARVAIAGSGFLADAYDLYIIGQVQSVLFLVYPVDEDDVGHVKSLLTTAALVGAICGQLLFGLLADRLGRKRIFIITGFTIVVGALISCLGWASTSNKMQIYYMIATGRFILGFGIGGEYPLSATIASESCTPRRRGTLMACVFSMQGVGYLISTLLMLILTSSCTNEVVWRVALGFGGVIPTVSLYFRMNMDESKDYQAVQQSRAQRGGGASVGQLSAVGKYKYHILGTALNWAIFDVVFYANGLFNSDVTSALSKDASSVHTKMMNTLIIVLIQLPGYLVAVLTINKLGRKNMQLMGFSMMTVLFFILGFTYESLKGTTWLFLTIYGLTFFFADFGPNTTTFIIPGEIYPAQIKASSHGVSAAAGKLGATIGTSCFELLNPKTPEGLKHAMLVCSGLSVVGLLVTVLFTPRYAAEDLESRTEGQSVGFVPLRWQRSKGQDTDDILLVQGSSVVSAPQLG